MKEEKTHNPSIFLATYWKLIIKVWLCGFFVSQNLANWAKKVEFIFFRSKFGEFSTRKKKDTDDVSATVSLTD